jgi:hypothetical protein
MKTQGNTEQEHDATEPADEGDIQMEYPLISFTAKVYEQ